MKLCSGEPGSSVGLSTLSVWVIPRCRQNRKHLESHLRHHHPHTRTSHDQDRTSAFLIIHNSWHWLGRTGSAFQDVGPLGQRCCWLLSPSASSYDFCVTKSKCSTEQVSEISQGVQAGWAPKERTLPRILERMADTDPTHLHASVLDYTMVLV